MEINEYTEQLAKAFITSYAALVNTLKSGADFDENALLSRLAQYSGLLAEKGDVGAGQFVKALVASLSGRPGDATLPTLH